MSQAPTVRWRLRPGVRVVRRGQDRVQVGLEPERRVVLPRSYASVDLLEALGSGGALPEHRDGEHILDLLRERDCVVEVRAPSSPRVALRVVGDPSLPSLAGRLSEAGLSLTRWEQEATAVLVVSVGEPPREVLDPLVREGTPHLLLRLVDGGATLGPFVQPGATACLRCLDAELAVADPERASVLLRYVEATSASGEPDDPALVLLTLGWAARDLIAFAEGREPSTWSRTLRWEPATTHPVVTRWLRQPGCGCGWHAWPTPDGGQDR